MQRNDSGNNEDEQSDASGDEPAVNAEDFYGSWKKTDEDLYLYIQGTGVYEWYDEDGFAGEGAYYMDTTGELCLEDSGHRFTLDGEGGMTDGDGNTYEISEIPEELFLGRGDTFDDEGPEVNADDFVNTWKMTDRDYWIYIQGIGVYEWYDADGLDGQGNYYVEDGVLCLENSDFRFTLDGEGGMTDNYRNTYEISELPSFN